MLKKHLVKAIGLTMSFALLATGCGGASTSTSTEPAESEQKAVITTSGESTVASGVAAGKDSIVFSMGTEPNSLDPVANSSDVPPRVVLIQVYDTLIREDSSDRTQIQPLLAESWEFENDAKTVVFKIKEDVKFHDGSLLTVEDVAFSLERAMVSPANLDLAVVMESVEIVDDSHVALNLNYAYNPVLNILTNPSFAIIDKEYYEACEADGTNFARNPMGTGAYQFVSWQSGANIMFEAFDDWHGGDVPIKNLEFRFMSDATTAAIALETGDVDVFYGVDSADLPRLRENEDINVLSVQSIYFYFLAFNCSAEPFNDERVRQAVNLAVNRQEIIDGGADGVGWTTECPITQGNFGYQEDFKASEQDLEKAKALLAEAGYPDGLTIELKTPEASYYSRPAQVVQEQLRQVGITVELSSMERGSFNTDLANKSYECVYFAAGASYPDADNLVYKLFHSDYADVTGILNMSNVNDPEADRIVEEARVSPDQDERYALYGELSQLNDDKAYYVPIMTSTNTICASSAVGGAYGNAGGYYYISDLYY